MPEETNDGVAYLMALRRSAGLPATNAETPATERDPDIQETAGSNGNADTQTQFAGAEKRRSPRYKCEGSAELREQGCDVRTWATFSDISLHGCYVEAQATYPAGTVLYLKLEANRFKVETKGNVRVNYPYLGIGIAFVEMTEENRTHLRELLSSISRPSTIMGPGIFSVSPTAGPLEDVPPISNPEIVVRELVEFFETRQMLMREDFLKILRSSQSLQAKP
jgi:PilZ domain-containing protein